MAKSPLQKFRKNVQTKKIGPRSHHKAEELVWGINPVEEALKVCPHAIREIIVAKEKPGFRLAGILELAQKHAIPVNTRSEKAKTGQGKPDELPEHKSSQGISARVILPNLTLDAFLVKLKDVSGPPLILALDSIQDPHNLGAIIRSAVAAGVNGIILPKDRSASITGTVIKISAGSVFHIDICRVANLLVIGSEGKGLRPLVANHCDLNIAIPMHSSLDSLNASVAAGIILFEIVRQRRAQYM
jgi:23S rRNA (guanosine2251-2'-O)-methyltransferase